MKRRTAKQQNKNSAAGKALEASKKLTRELTSARENKKIATRLQAEQLIQRKSDNYSVEVAREILAGSSKTLKMAGF